MNSSSVPGLETVDGTVKGVRTLTTANTPSNSMAFFVEQMISSLVETAEVVSINSADQTGSGGPAGYADATPLVCPLDSFKRALPPSRIAGLPFFRPQAGKAAIVMDPQPGDKAVLIAMKRDSSGVASGNNSPVQPASFRSYDQADGYLINGFLGEQPEIWLHLNPVSGDISLSTKAADIDISCRESGDIEISTKSGNITLKTAAGNTVEQATGSITKKCPSIILDGNVRVTGNLSVQGKSTGPGGGPAVFSKGLVNESGGIANTGGITNTGGVIRSGTVTLDTHTHTGVLAGGDSTGSPNGGS